MRDRRHGSGQTDFALGHVLPYRGRVLARLILALLFAAFSLPAAAASCHDARAPSAHVAGMHHGEHRPPVPEAPAHACLGCVPPCGLLGARVAPPLPVQAASPVARAASLDLGTVQPPALPPPRRG